MKLFHTGSGCLPLVVMVLSASSTVCAGQGQVRLTSSLILQPACLINNNTVTNGGTASKLGTVDFGSYSVSFTQAGAALSNEFNALKIYCPVNSSVSVSFNQGLNGTNVPAGYKNNYQRAMGNGSGQYLAYQLYKDNRTGQVLTPSTNLSFSGGVEHQLKIYAEAVNDRLVSKGEYTDQITVTVSF